MTRRRERLVEGLPEPERAIANGDLRRDRQAARLQGDEQLLPALRALPHARLKADQLLLAPRRRPPQPQHAFGLRLHARLQIDAVRPDVDVMARRQIALLPSPIFVLPFALEARDHRRGKVGRVLAEQGGEGLLEIAGGNPAQIENRQKGVEALGATRPFGQDVRREAKALPRSGGAIAGLRLLHLDPADPSPGRANRIMPVANHPLAATRKHELRGRGQKCLELRLHRLGDQPTRAGSQYFSERIIDCPFLSKGNNSILTHGVALLLGGSGGLITNPVTPPSSHRHPVSPRAPAPRPPAVTDAVKAPRERPTPIARG